MTQRVRKETTRHYMVALSSLSKQSGTNMRLHRITLSCHYCHPYKVSNYLVYNEFIRNVKMTAN